MPEEITEQVLDAPVVPVVAEVPVTEPIVETPPVTEGEKEVPVKALLGPITEDLVIPDISYMGQKSSITIPVDLHNYAVEKGIDIKSVSEELYGSEDFTLSDETLKGLYEAFGKFQVDSYLESVKMKNDIAVGSMKAMAEAQTAEAAKAWEATMEIMGGEDKWEALSEYAAANMDKDEIAEFNNVMEHGSLRMQQLMIKDAYSRYTASIGTVPVVPSMGLEEGANMGATDAIGPLSKQAYHDLLHSGKYKENPAKYDQLRRLGMAKGL